MKLSITLICFLSFLIGASAQSPLEGQWNTGKENTIIVISQSEGVYKGSVVSSDNDQLPIGSLFLKDLIATENGDLEGKIFSFKKRKWYDAKLSVDGDSLNAKIKTGITSKSLTWRRE